MSSPNRTFKVHVGDDIRRFVVPLTNTVGPDGYEAFNAKVSEIFPGEDLTYKWKDADGDLITIGNSDDFTEAVTTQPTGPVRLHAFKKGVSSDEVSGTPKEAKSEPEPTPAPKPQPKPEPVTHEYVTCDASGESPLRGTRYHKIGENYDLNETEFVKLPEPEKQFYETILYPGAPRLPYEPVIHYGVVCDVSNVGPIIGTRFHKIGENYDLCLAEFAKLDEEEKRKYELVVHPRKPPFPYARPASEEDADSDEGNPIPQFARLLQDALKFLPDGSVDVSMHGPGGRGVPHFLRELHRQHTGAGRCGRANAGRCGGGGGKSRCPQQQAPGTAAAGGGRFGDTKEVLAGDVLPTGTFGRGSYGEGVEQLQRFLIEHGLMDATAIVWRAGIYGPRTRQCIADFQRSNAVPTNHLGMYNDSTRAALLALAEVTSMNKEPAKKATQQDQAQSATAPPKYNDGDSGAGEKDDDDVVVVANVVNH